MTRRDTAHKTPVATGPRRMARTPARLVVLLAACALLLATGICGGAGLAWAALVEPVYDGGVTMSAAETGEVAQTGEVADSGDTAEALAADFLWARGLGAVVQENVDVVVPILFPLEERITWIDTYGAPRDGGTRTHEGNDLIVPKMTPLLAVVSGEVDWLNLDGSSSSYYLLLRGDDGNDYFYIHINNDTPGTDDGLGGPENAYSPKIVAGGEGTHVECGEFIAYVGDSGNAEYTVPHLHFEIHYSGYKNPINPYASLMAAPTLAEWEAAGRPDLSNPEPTIPYVSLRGDNRYDTAIKISQAMFPEALPAGSGVVLAPGETYQEALCGAPLAAAWGGPVLLTYQAALANDVKAELERLAPQNVVCIGMAQGVVDAVRAALPAATVSAITGSGSAPDAVYDMSYQVALALGERVNATGGDISTSTAIITIGSKFPDAIGVSPLACAQKWPVLLTDAADDSPLHASAAAALAELNITRALKVGTYATLPETVQGVGNLSGADRYYTNCNVATWAQACAGLSFAHTGLATGDKFPDALAAGPYLALDRGILLLTPLDGPLPSAVCGKISGNSASMLEFSFIAMIDPVLTQVKRMLP